MLGSARFIDTRRNPEDRGSRLFFNFNGMDMQTPWQRKRQPDDVPTPVAVALSDYCRRAQSPAPAPEIRAALALLSESDDFRLQALAEGEPEASPLGPYAVIDVLLGTSAQLAAQRQSVGYYDLARDLAEAMAQPQPEVSAVVASPAAPLPLETREPLLPSEGKRTRKQKEAAQSVSERIAPKKREAVPQVEIPPELQLPPKRELPKGRGRFTRLSAQRLPCEQLLLTSAHDHLVGLVEQYPHRLALQNALSAEYVSPRSDSPQLADLEAALRKHALAGKVAAKEREAILGAYTEHRGAEGRVAWALGIRPAELTKLVALNGLKDEAE